MRTDIHRADRPRQSRTTWPPQPVRPRAPAFIATLIAALGLCAGAPAGAHVTLPDAAASAAAELKVAASLPSPPFDLSDAARVAAGKARFGATCAAYCHGREGEGGKTPPFKGRSDLTPDSTFKVISEGRRGTDVMPPWGKAFSPEEIWELVAYIQHLGRQPRP